MRISSFRFCGQLAGHYLHVFNLSNTLPMDEFLFIEMRTWGQSKIWCMVQIKIIREQGEFKISNTNFGKLLFLDLLPALKRYWAESHLELFILLRLNPGVFMDSCLAIDCTHLPCLLSRWVSPVCSLKRYWIELHMEFCQTSTLELLFSSKLYGAPLDDWANGGYVWWTSSGVVIWCLCKFFGELILFQGMRMELRGEIMSHSF